MSLDTQTLIHVGTEVVIIAGVTFWMNKKINFVESKVDELTRKLATYEEIISQQQQLIARHEQALRRLFGGDELPTPVKSERKEKTVPPSQPTGTASTSPNPSQPPPRVEQLPDQESQPETKEVEIVDEEPDIPAEELDLMLEKELGKLPEDKKPRKKSSLKTQNSKSTKTPLQAKKNANEQKD